MTIAPDGRKLLRIEARNTETPIERKPESVSYTHLTLPTTSRV